MGPDGKKLAGQIALVTGVGRGLGRALALHLARLGADVAVNDINMKAHLEYKEELTAESVVEEVRALGVRGLEVEADVTSDEQVKDMFDRIDKEFGRLDILVNNAGGALFGLEYRPTLELNLMGTVLCCQAASAIMKRQKSGKIVNMGSQSGLQGKGGGAYNVAKAAVLHYTRVLASELGPSGINVNCIAPGWVLTSRAVAWGRAEPEQREEIEAQIPLGRLAEPEDCAKVVEFLVTDLSDYVTGQTICVCGGSSIL